ncbi:hypothetical protein TrCOL_g1604 [Triparma columacea]|uniref:Uncharacterized protein n=1 Tax=Triparma columacea TaxID=722753 RepID=A0A9W7GIL3_9STRA|nr:hypothetical protein TrCOL_g1604 [Triparma columacea]
MDLRLGGPVLEAFDEGSEDSSNASSTSDDDSSVVTTSTAAGPPLTESSAGESHFDDSRSEVNSEFSYASTQASNFSSRAPNTGTPKEGRVSIMGDLPSLSLGSDEASSSAGKTTASEEREARVTVKLHHERTRASLIDKAWSSGVQGRRRLEAGFTLDVVKRLTHLRVQYGEEDFETAYKLVLWIVESWPCDPPNSTIPVDPWKLGRDCGEMLLSYRPGGDKMDPNNSAYLLPTGLRTHAKGMDLEEMRGAVNGWAREIGGGLSKIWEEQSRGRREIKEHEGKGGGLTKSPSLSKRIYAGINDET